MKHISLLIPEGDVSFSNLEATYKMFTKVNEALQRTGQEPLFQVQLVGLTQDARITNGLFSIQPERVVREVSKTNVIIIPAVHGDMPQVIAANRDFGPWIVHQHRQGAEVVSLCIGAFILASTGLLSGRSCTTHWLAADKFRKLFPDVHLLPYKIITDEGGIYTSGGAYSSLNLILYLVEKYAGRNMAIRASKIFEIDIDRHSQSPFIIFQGQKEHHDEAIKKVQEYIEQNFQHKMTVEELAEMAFLSRRNFERRFKKATSNTVMEYLQRVKVEAAKLSLETSQDNVNEVMYSVGYSDTKAFRATFKKITGISPLEYRNKYHKAVAEPIMR
ncbi:GlxA family transcriptional regulator [Rufibacter immobilis]|uniref:GlxA family transcriptional regulator n=1 Tax=Rufibacter immobilis TaxID=1348778 RepID=UPI0035F02AF3